MGAAYSGAMDLVLCVLAWVIIWKLQVSAREKIGVGIALTFGVLYVPLAPTPILYKTNVAI